jgi:hypothetical protein
MQTSEPWNPAYLDKKTGQTRKERGMTHIRAMIDAHPKGLDEFNKAKLAECISACFECAQTCTACADACLSEETVAELVTCIGTDLDCADICATTGNVLSRHAGYNGGVTRALLEACRAACKACAEECDKHADMHDHCQVCAEACRRCEQACADLLTSLDEGAEQQ